MALQDSKNLVQVVMRSTKQQQQQQRDSQKQQQWQRSPACIMTWNDSTVAACAARV
jgi:hypothetical protein